MSSETQHDERWLKFAAGKFYPPAIDPARHLPRRRLLNQLRERPSRRILLIEAQAGQGKSIFAAQVVGQVGSGYCWYQIGAEDQDSIAFVSNLLACFQQQFPTIQAPLLAPLLRRGDGTHDPALLASLLLRELQTHLSGDFCLVFDDVYLLEGAPASLSFLKELLHATPACLRFILVSRHPVSLLVHGLLPDGEVTLIDNAALALTLRETAELCSEVLELPASGETVRLLHQLTEGWVMGLVLAGQAVSDGVSAPEQSLLASLRAIPQGSLLDYFLTNIFPRFSTLRQRMLLRFSLLETIPVALAEKLTEGEARAGALLRELHGSNLFVRPLDSDGTEYVLHHLFHQGLRSLVPGHFSASEIARAHRMAADWYRLQNRPVEALHHLLNAGDYTGAARLLKDLGLDLLANNRLATLHAALQRIPAEELRQQAWLAYYAGIGNFDINPPAALIHLKNAHQRFLLEGEEVGELLTLVRLIAYHAMVDGWHHLAAAHIERAAALFAARGGDLPPVQRAHAANVFLMAFSIIRNDIARADTYYDAGLRIARQLRMTNLEAEARLWRMYRHIFVGDVPRLLTEIEAAVPLLHSPLVTPLHKAGIYLAFLNGLVNIGDHAGYRYHRQRFRTLMGGDMVDHSVLGAFVNLWNIDLATAQGDQQACHELLERALAADYAGSGPHLRSQYLQYKALTAALSGKETEALVAAEEALRLRREVGCPFFIAACCGIVGGAYALLGQTEKALALFQTGLDHSQSMGEIFARAALHAYRAWLYLEAGEHALARQDLVALLDCLRRYGHGHFYGWQPQLMGSLLSAAVRQGINSDFARQLARERLDLSLLDDGTAIALLQVHTLGGLRLQLGDRIILRGEELTPAQRQLLLLLLASAGLRGSREELASQLWPDSCEENARNSFDVLLTRLRKTVAEAADKEQHAPYITLRKGVLVLEHARVDVLVFRQEANLALRQLREGQHWQADNTFRRAVALWQGPFAGNLSLPERLETIRESLLALYLKVVCHWAPLLTADGRLDEAEELVAAALPHDPINEDLVRLLHTIHTAAKRPAKARQVLDAYARALRESDFTAKEIEELLDAFWSRTG